MNKKGFRNPRKKDPKAVEQFAEGADMRSNTENSSNQEPPEEDKETQQAFYTTLQPRFKEIIQAMAYYERISQREVVEQALEDYYGDNQHELQKALTVYRRQSD